MLFRSGKEIAGVFAGEHTVEFTSLVRCIGPGVYDLRLIAHILEFLSHISGKLSHHRYSRVTSCLAKIEEILLTSAIMVQGTDTLVEPLRQAVLVKIRTASDILYNGILASCDHLITSEETDSTVNDLTIEIYIDIAELCESIPATGPVTVGDINDAGLLEVLTPYQLRTVIYGLTCESDMLKRSEERRVGKECRL